MTPAIPTRLLEAVYAHAEETYPEECCGFLTGAKDAAVTEQRRVPNRQNELHAADPLQFPRDARTAYNMGASDLLFLDKSLSSLNPVQIIYHSHCDVGAYFSAEDERAATYDGVPLYPTDYLVIDVQKGKALGAKLFRFDDATGRFAVIADFGPPVR